MKTYSFTENNSGGSWWLGYKEYKRLFDAGWYYEASDWDKENGYDVKEFIIDLLVSTSDTKRKGSIVPFGWRNGGLKFKAKNIREAVESWEEATKMNFFEQGCNCCGCPFSISSEGSKDWEYMSGSDADIEVKRPW